ncbi:hypothetical protein D3C87_1458310 [compost metagenome]
MLFHYLFTFRCWIIYLFLHFFCHINSQGRRNFEKGKIGRVLQLAEKIGEKVGKNITLLINPHKLVLIFLCRVNGLQIAILINTCYSLNFLFRFIHYQQYL